MLNHRKNRLSASKQAVFCWMAGNVSRETLYFFEKMWYTAYMCKFV